MASSASNPSLTHHSRSISLPSRPNPLALNVDEHLRRLASSLEATSTSPSSSSLSCGLGELRDLYNSVDALLELPHTQQLLARGSHSDRVDGLSSSSLRFLDVCGIAKDVLMQTKEQVQDLQSVLRRKKGDDAMIIKECGKYLSVRKVSKKAISKSLKELKSQRSNSFEPNTEAIFDVLRQVEVVSAALFGSLLSFLLGSRVYSKASGWSLVSKLITSSNKRVSCDQESFESNELESVDSMLEVMIGRKTRKNIDIGKEGLQNELRRLESSIQDFEEELESVIRHIIRTRASLLNIITN